MKVDKDEEAEVDPKDEVKVLITYYSHSGNTQELSSLIHSEVGGALEELFTIKNYPAGYDELLPIAQQEKEENARPELAKNAKDPKEFDIIYIGFPIWCDTMPMAVYTYLESYDMAGKTIIPFCTEGGSGFGDSIEQIKELCPDATVLDGFYVNGDSVGDAGKDVIKWLDSIGMLPDKEEK